MRPPTTNLTFTNVAPELTAFHRENLNMADLVNELTSRTGISPELVQKGLGALLSFLKKELGEETFDKVSASIPEASALTSRYESAPETPEAGPCTS